MGAAQEARGQGDINQNQFEGTVRFLYPRLAPKKNDDQEFTHPTLKQ